MKTIAALTAFSVLIVALVVVASYSAGKSSELLGAAAVHATADRVFIGFGTEVVIARHDGTVLAVASDDAGRPWPFVNVSAFAVDEKGRLLVADAGRGEVVRFEADGTGGTPLAYRGEPHRGFEIAALPNGQLAVAETSRHRVHIIDQSGDVLATQKVKYPNGISTAIGPAGEPLVYVLETGALRLHAFDLRLQRVETKTLTQLRTLARGLSDKAPGFPIVGREMLDFSLVSERLALLHACRDTSGDCTMLQLELDPPRVTAVGDSSIVRTDRTSWADAIQVTTESAPGPDGRVYVASPRFGAVLVFAPPPTGVPLCVDCLRGELKDVQVQLAKLVDGPVALPNGGELSLFGDPALRARFVATSRGRVFYDAMEHTARYGVIAAALGLLVLLFVLRQSGTLDSKALQSRMAAIWQQLVVPEIRVLVASGAIVAGAAGVGAAVGWGLLRESGVLPFALGAGALAARTVASRLLANARRPQFAADAWGLQFQAIAAAALIPGEHVDWVTVGRPVRKITSTLKDAAGASEASDPLEILEHLAPKVTLIARTSERLILAQVSALGAPVEAVLVADVTKADSDGALSLTTRDREVAFIGPGPSANTGRFVAQRILYRCERCGARVGRCVHSVVRSAALPILLTALCPGLGHLLQYRFRRGRVLMLVALGFAMTAASPLISQILGTLPFAPSKFAAPLLGYVIVLVGGMVDVVAWTVRQRRRAELNESSVEESEPDYADLKVG